MTENEKYEASMSAFSAFVQEVQRIHGFLILDAQVVLVGDDGEDDTNPIFTLPYGGSPLYRKIGLLELAVHHLKEGEF